MASGTVAIKSVSSMIARQAQVMAPLQEVLEQLVAAGRRGHHWGAEFAVPCLGELAQRGVQDSPRCRLDLQGALARHFVLPQIHQFFERYPGVELEIGMGDRLVDLVREGIDCVLRVGEPRESSMVARRVASLRQVTCASIEYLERHGVPKSVDDFRGHRAVNFLSTSTGKALPFEFLIDGQLRTVRLAGSVAVTDADDYVACCAAHLGFVQLPRYHVEARLKDGTLREVLPKFRPDPMPVSVMYPHHRQLSPRVRVFVDWLADVMGRAQ